MKTINVEQANYKIWCKADLWTIERAILLLLNAETLPSASAYKSSKEQSTYDGFMEIWPIAESSLKTGLLKKIGKSYPSLFCEVLPGDFIHWAKLKGYSIPDELKAIGTPTQDEAVKDIGKKVESKERELVAWLRVTWINESEPGGTAFFTKLKKYVNQKGSPIVEHYSAGKDAGISWQTSAGIRCNMVKKTILNKVSTFNNKP